MILEQNKRGLLFKALFLKGVYFYFFLFSFLDVSAGVNRPAQDTLRMNLKETEKKFIEKNFLLLAQKFNIEEAKAYQIQAKLWSNPSVYFEQNIYNQNTKKYFDASKSGENIVQIQQLVLLAGKRNKQFSLAKINAEISEYIFFDLIRTLKYELRSNFFRTYFLQQTSKIYTEEIKSLQKTVNLYEQQHEKGNISLKEVLRLKAFLFNLANEDKNLRTLINESQLNLLLLLGDTTSAYVVPEIERSVIDSVNTASLNISQLIETAETHRYDLKAQEATTRYARQNLSLQKAMSIPDMRVGGVYDKNGNYIPNYYALNVQIDLPVLNRNQGNIKAAKSKVQQSEALYNNYQLQVEKEVEAAYFKCLENDKLFKDFDGKFPSEFNLLIEGIIRNYEKRTIGLVEFIDFYEAYKNSVLQFNQLQIDRLDSFEELNYTTGESIINY